MGSRALAVLHAIDEEDLAIGDLAHIELREVAVIIVVFVGAQHALEAVDLLQRLVDGVAIRGGVGGLHGGLEKIHRVVGDSLVHLGILAVLRIVGFLEGLADGVVDLRRPVGGAVPAIGGGARIVDDDGGSVGGVGQARDGEAGVNEGAADEDGGLLIADVDQAVGPGSADLRDDGGEVGLFLGIAQLHGIRDLDIVVVLIPVHDRLGGADTVRNGGVEDRGVLDAQRLIGVSRDDAGAQGVEVAGLIHPVAALLADQLVGAASDVGHFVLIDGVDDGQHVLREVGADDGGDALIVEQAVGGVHAGLHVVDLVAHDQLDLLAEDAAVGVDLVHGQLRAIEVQLAGEAVDAGYRSDDAEVDSIVIAGVGHIFALGRGHSGKAQKEHRHYQCQYSSHSFHPYSSCCYFVRPAGSARRQFTRGCPSMTSTAQRLYIRHFVPLILLFYFCLLSYSLTKVLFVKNR